MIYKKAGLIRPDLRSEEIIFKKISAQNKKNVIAPERNNISASKTRKPAIDPTVSQKPKPHKRIVDSLKIKRPKVKKIKMKLASFCKENFSKNTENKKLSKDFKPKPQAPREGIPEFEEGFPRSEFGSRDDHKKDSKGNFTDSRKNKLF